MSAAAAAPAVRGAEASGALLPLGLARSGAYGALALFGGLHWMQLVEPAQQPRALVAVALGMAVCCLLLLARALPGALGPLVAAATAVSASALAILAAGVGDELLAPGRLSELLAGLTRGVEAIPGARVPYRGLDEWTRITLTAGGTLLIVVAALLAFWPRRGGIGFRVPALIALVALYATPAVALVFDGEFARGALLTLLVLAFLRLERLGSRDVPGAIAAGTATAVLALMIAPMLDRENPWWDYETWALSAASSRSTAFNWDHEYGPLDWPRDGRELLRVKAEFSTYWKADSLDLFDGTHWRHAPLQTQQDNDMHIPYNPVNLQRYRQTITVTVRNLRSRNFVTAGIADNVTFPRREALPSGVAGIWRAPRTLRRGDAYSAHVYTPRGRPRELRRAGTDYEGWLEPYRTMRIADAEAPQIEDPATGAVADAARYEVTFPEFDVPSAPVYDIVRYVNDDYEDATPLLESSRYGRVWALAQELKAGATTPYDYARAVERHLADGYSYTETPPRESSTLDGFLFESRSGYCQQFSGAMALLLRMGGVPARVATGFTSGSQDEDTKEFVVRDFDAHSWVEAWFPGWGWVPFDPTPAAAPPRAQAPAGGLDTAGLGDVRDLGTGRAASDPRLAGAGGAGIPWPQVLGAGLIVLVALLLAWRLGGPLLGATVHRRRLSPLAELERALRRARLAPPAGQTLRAIETRFPPSAAAYVRAVRDARFAGRPTHPTPQQRRALRAALGRGSLAARLRSYWALPPRPRA